MFFFCPQVGIGNHLVTLGDLSFFTGFVLDTDSAAHSQTSDSLAPSAI
jgi:hypothetical protein